MKFTSALIVFLLLFFAGLIFPLQSVAIVDPLSLPNNKVGVHILFPTELQEASRLVNANGGDWGYVTIPIQSTDKDLIKWQSFMDEANKYHIIPIIRLATEGNYFDTSTWSKPTEADVLDFANFLNSLEWPTKNRYIIVFNEVNRADEWQGNPDASEYANILKYAVDVFKSRNPDFYIISSGLDNASITIPGVSINEYSFLRQMNDAVPGIFGQIDALGSHSYPNPGFRQPAASQGYESVASFQYERNLAKNLSGKDLPVFITETGWSAFQVSDTLEASYYQQAFSTIWNDSHIIAVTPFLLFANSEPFKSFSLLSASMSQTESYKSISQLPKVKGTPMLSPHEFIPSTNQPTQAPVKNFDNTQSINNSIHIPPPVKTLLKWMLKI